MRRFRQRRKSPSVRYADRYFGLGAREARRLGHHYIGSDHVLLAMTNDRGGTVANALERLGAPPDMIHAEIRRRPGSTPPTAIDPQALAALGIDLDAVRERVEQTFGEGALEDTRTGCMRVEPCLKQVLGHALDRAGGAPLGDEHVLLSMLSVPDSDAARVLARLGVSLQTAEAEIGSRRE